MFTLFKDKNDINWRFFPLFLIIVFLVGIILIYLLFPSPEIKRIPIIIKEDPERVEDSPVFHRDIQLSIFRQLFSYQEFYKERYYGD